MSRLSFLPYLLLLTAAFAIGMAAAVVGFGAIAALNVRSDPGSLDTPVQSAPAETGGVPTVEC
jgi:hypothetical protein